MERNKIALLSNRLNPIDPPSGGWLGHHSSAVRREGARLAAQPAVEQFPQRTCSHWRHHPEVPMRLYRIAAVVLTCLALMLPAPVAAQTHFISRAALISILENHKGAVLRYIDAAPDSMLGFRPTTGVRTFAEQIEHAAGSDAFIAHLAITGSAKGIPAMGDSAVYLHNKAALRTFAAAAMDHTIGMLRGLSDGALDEHIVQFGHKVTRGRALMELLDHFPWTLGQTVPYLRLNGVTPPEYSPF